MRAFESIGDMFTSIVENLRAPGKQKFDPVPRWMGGRITIARSAEDVYGFWRASTNIPKVIRVVRFLEIHEGGVTDWTLRGHTGQALSFTCEQVVESPGRRIEWRSTKDAPVHSTLAVSFMPKSDTESELVVEWTVALRPDQNIEMPLTLDGLLDDMTQRMLDDDLDRLRAVLELEGRRRAEEAAAAEAAHEKDRNETESIQE